jgi:ABC-2 type transport system ATP-binding protein
MRLITVENLSKEFRHAVKKPGLVGAVQHLYSQKYKTKVAVDHISFTIDKGESIAYVGPNGAGKSTTIKMLTGILVPSSGQVVVDGLIPHKQRIDNAKKIGAVFGQRTQLWWDIPIIESLALLKDIYEIPENTYKRNMELFADILGLGEFLHLSARKISLGQRMRADLAAALLHNPQILYLDEPTIGLDVAVKVRIRKFIKQINKESGTTIMLTTHDLDDIEDICRRLIIIDQGKIIYDGELQSVKDAFAQERAIHFEVRDPILLLDRIVSDLPDVILENNEAQRFSIRFNRFKTAAGEVIGHIMKHGDVLDIRIDEPKIEQVIRQVYDGKLDLTAKKEEMV